MASVNALIEKLLESPPASVADAGDQLLDQLSSRQLSREQFLSDPLALVGPPYFASRYLTQVTLRALQGEYETSDEVLASLTALIERNPPILEPRREAAASRVVLPEARVLELRQPAKLDDGGWESFIDALVTSGPLRDREVRIRIRASENKTVCFLVQYLWIHSSFAAYNLAAAGDLAFEACPETFIVVEPMRQVNATSIARALYCTKPLIDQTRKGKGDVTVQTLKGQLVHALFDRMLEGAADLEVAYRSVLPGFLVPLASVTDEFFDEDAFHADVLRHAAALKEFIGRNPHLLEHTQLELKRYSATIGIQGRIDAVFREGNRLDILELKTGARIRPEDHAQLFIYRLLLSDLIRRWQRSDGHDVETTSRLLSSIDGSFAPLRVMTDFYQVLDARNKLVAGQYALGRTLPHVMPRHEGFNEAVCSNCPSWTRNRCKDSSNIFGDRPGAASSEELEYFRKFTRLVQHERWLADQDLADLLDDSRLQSRINSFRTISGATIVPGADAFTFQFDANTSDLQPGDSVLIHAGRISSTSTYHGYVAAVDTRRMRVSIPLKNLAPAALEGQHWIIDKFPSDVTAEASHTALYDFLASPVDGKKRAILGMEQPETSLRAAGLQPLPSPALNASQVEAVERAVNCGVFHLIWGPPGTGKTKVIPEIVERVAGPVLLGAFTNTAVDKMLLALLAHDPSTRFLRVGRSSDSPEVARAVQGDPADFFTEDLALKYGTIRAVKDTLRQTRIIAATAHRASTLPYLRKRAFEMAVVDEAGQLTEPLTLGLILRARRFVLIGDDRQLPPVVRTHALAHSMFERLKRETGTVTLLETQYRMHPQIMDVSNRLFYEGRLKAGVSENDRRPPEGEPVVFVPVESDRDGRSSIDEARVVVQTVRSLMRDSRVPSEAIGVVSPFRAQVVLLRQLLADTGITVDTVERFQGGERDIMILSFVRSRGTGFVFDDRRLNVAITRARRQLILVAHPGLFKKSRYEWICTSTETLKTAATT